MTGNTDIEEKLRRIEAKLDQCIAMNNETRMMCDRILHEVMEMKAGPEVKEENMAALEEEMETESRKVRIQRAREQKELLTEKISDVAREREKVKNEYFKATDKELAKELSLKMDNLEKELENLQAELTKCLEYQQKAGRY
jgi:chromosome segregation ATPase